jgi:hypothetical protein
MKEDKPIRLDDSVASTKPRQAEDLVSTPGLHADQSIAAVLEIVRFREIGEGIRMTELGAQQNSRGWPKAARHLSGARTSKAALRKRRAARQRFGARLT